MAQPAISTVDSGGIVKIIFKLYSYLNHPSMVGNLTSCEYVLNANFKIIEILTLNDDKKSLSNLMQN